LELSKRVQAIKPSPTLAVTARAAKLKAEGKDIIGLGAGEPDFDTPQHIKDAAIAAINRGFTKYTAVGGTPSLKQAVITKFKRDNGLDYTAKQILVSCGGKQSFFNLALAVINPGDEVIIPAPYWVSYPVMVAISGAKPVIINGREENGFKITPDEFEDAITPATKAIVINSPSNPTGAAYLPEELKAIADMAVKKGVFIISDEIYEKLCYDNHPFISMASFSDEIKRQTIVLNGVSKTYSMTGWRIGYAAGPKELIKAMTNIQSQSTSNPTSISQKAAVEALNGPQDTVEEMRVEFDKRRKAMVNNLNAIKGIRCMLPPGSFYVFPNIAKLLKKRFNGKAINSSADLAEFLLEVAEVAVVPG